jgi:hypothetical protein
MARLLRAALVPALLVPLVGCGAEATHHDAGKTTTTDVVGSSKTTVVAPPGGTVTVETSGIARTKITTQQPTTTQVGGNVK